MAYFALPRSLSHENQNETINIPKPLNNSHTKFFNHLYTWCDQKNIVAYEKIQMQNLLVVNDVTLI